MVDETAGKVTGGVPSGVTNSVVNSSSVYYSAPTTRHVTPQAEAFRVASQVVQSRRTTMPHRTTSVPVPVEVPPLRQRDPYAVERHPAPRNWVRMVGFDRHGEYLSECTIPGHKFTQATVDKFRRWLMENDDSPVMLSLSE